MVDQSGIILAAPASGSGKTTITLGLLRALARRGDKVSGAKSGPDYIDPRFHAAACKRPCVNLDAWSMSPDRIMNLAMSGSDLLLIEGAMGLFDGAPPVGRGATADLARMLTLPVILIVDCTRLAQSISPIVSGFVNHDPDVPVAGVILNNIGSPRHEKMLRDALRPQGIPVLGAMYRNRNIEHPSRHLGLVQAHERKDLEVFLDQVADQVESSVDLDLLANLAQPLPRISTSQPRMSAPGQNIAIASDAAFAFSYPHILADWQAQGSTITPFSPLADEAPVQDADFIFLPGGYPELHAKTLSQAQNFKQGMRRATCQIYGECGGYMTLGQAIIDKEGARHEMLGLLGLETSFQKRKLHLGYRQLRSRGGAFLGDWKAHEFHYATTLTATGEPLFDAQDAEGNELPPMGLIKDHVSGSFAHLIEPDRFG